MGRSWGDCRTCNTADGGANKQPHYRWGLSATRFFRWQGRHGPRGGRSMFACHLHQPRVGSLTVIVPTMREALRNAANYTRFARWLCTPHPTREWIILAATKLAYVGYMIEVPIAIGR